MDFKNYKRDQIGFQSLNYNLIFYLVYYKQFDWNKLLIRRSRTISKNYGFLLS